MPGDSAGRDEPKLRAATAARRRLLLMLGVAELQHIFRKFSPWMHRAIGLALAMAFSTLIEETKLLDSFEDAVVREVARQRSLADEMALPDPNALQIQHLEISAQARVSWLEQRTGVDHVIERLGGVAPIHRGEMAELLLALAERLPPVEPGGGRVLAIDIDLAPLEGEATPTFDREQMLKALDKLREKAHVIVIVLPRPAGASGAREARNQFMTQVGCTRLSPVAASPSGRHALFFASPRLFQSTGSYPTKYPYELDRDSKGAAGNADGERALPPHYPSLGTLMHLQFTHRFAHDQVPVAAMESERNAEVSSARQTLTALCEQAHAAQPGGELLEDRMASSATAQDIAKAYQQRRYSWRLLDDPSLQHTVVERTKTSGWASDLGEGVLDRPVLLLGIDGGAGHDKFGIAGISAQPISGAGLHALQALSIGTRPSPLLDKLAGIGVDLLLGLIYWLAWDKLFKHRLIRLRQNMPVIGGWLIVGVPLVLGLGLTWVCFKVAAVAMGIDLWVNPIYIVASLLLVIYVDAWSASEPADEEEQRLRSRLLGLPAARDALRSGFGSRVERMHFAASSSSFPITGMNELRVQAEVVRSRLGSAALADAVLSAVLRLVVLCAGWGLIVHELIKAWRS